MMHSSAAAADDRLRVSVDDSKRYQRFWGVGASITGASAQLISQLPPQQRGDALTRLFSRTDGIGLSVLRQPLGANDFSIGSQTYDDVSSGGQDRGLQHFSLGRAESLILPLVRKAQMLNPSATVVASPWSAPAWMKSSGSLIGGTLRAEYYDVYARYLLRAVQAYVAAGVRVGGLTLQNEPSFSPPGYPGMTLSADQQRELLAHHLKPALDAAGLGQTGIWALDDNYARTPDAERMASDPSVRSRIAGVAFHCYRGDLSAMKDFHDKHPDLPLAISECTGGDWSPQFAANLRFDVETLLINGIRDGASWVSKWNVALDPSGGPTNGGCTNCRGVITIHPEAGSVSYEEAFYAFGHLGKFVTPGAQVVSSATYGDASIETVAFLNPDRSHVLLALNAADHQIGFRVVVPGRSFDYTLAAGAVATFTW
jgi:glucosylceramidase